MSQKKDEEDCGCGGTTKVTHKDTSITSIMQSSAPLPIKKNDKVTSVPANDSYEPFITDARTTGSFRRSALDGYDSE